MVLLEICIWTDWERIKEAKEKAKLSI